MTPEELNECSLKCTEDVQKVYKGLRVEIVEIRDNDIRLKFVDDEHNYTVLTGWMQGDRTTLMYTENVLHCIEHKKFNTNEFVEGFLEYSKHRGYLISGVARVITNKRCRDFIRKIYLFAIEGFLNKEIPLGCIVFENDFILSETEVSAVNSILIKSGLTVDHIHSVIPLYEVRYLGQSG